MYTLFCCSQKLVSFVLLIMIMFLFCPFILIDNQEKQRIFKNFHLHKKKKSSWDSFLKDQFVHICFGLGTSLCLEEPILVFAATHLNPLIVPEILWLGQELVLDSFSYR